MSKAPRRRLNFHQSQEIKIIPDWYRQNNKGEYEIWNWNWKKKKANYKWVPKAQVERTLLPCFKYFPHLTLLPLGTVCDICNTHFKPRYEVCHFYRCKNKVRTDILKCSQVSILRIWARRVLDYKPSVLIIYDVISLISFNTTQHLYGNK